MSLAFLIVLLCLTGCYAGYVQQRHGPDYFAPANYKYVYGINDPHTGDQKSQYETRHGDVVKGGYSLHEPDGTIRVVEYTSDPHSGFNAVVKKVGHSVHPQYYKTYGNDGHEVNQGGYQRGYNGGYKGGASSYADINNYNGARYY